MFRGLLLSLLLFPMCSCAGYGAEYREILVQSHSADDIFTEIVRYSRVNGWRPDLKETNKGERIYTSRWRGGGGPILGRDGSPRKRLFAQVVRPRDTRGWIIQYYIERQRIGEVGRGLQPRDQDWTAAGQDVALEQHFHYALTDSLLGTGFNGAERENR